jgi:hypothetical protein
MPDSSRARQSAPRLDYRVETTMGKALPCASASKRAE